MSASCTVKNNFLKAHDHVSLDNIFLPPSPHVHAVNKKRICNHAGTHSYPETHACVNQYRFSSFLSWIGKSWNSWIRNHTKPHKKPDTAVHMCDIWPV